MQGQQEQQNTGVLTDNIYDELSKERKLLQEKGLIPPWATTSGWQLFKSKYLYGAPSWKAQYQRIAKTAAKYTDDPSLWEDKFFDIMWKGWLSLSTPVLANMGTDRGLPISCSGCYVGDDVASFYETQTEIAVLSKHGFGTSAYLGDIRPRGSKISVGGKASGIMPVLKDLVQVCRDISQGSARRGAGAWYLPIEHSDFKEVVEYVKGEPDDVNIGWCISDNFVQRMNAEDAEAISRFQEAMSLKMTLGKGYFFFPDKANRQRPETYEQHGLDIKASQLCSEIILHSSDDYSYTCCLSSMVVALWDEWKDTDAVFTATVFLDCVMQDFIEKAKKIKHLEKAVAFSEKGRALGLGQMGLFSLFQKQGLNPEGFEAHALNNLIAKEIWCQALTASQWMAQTWGEPEWCKGFGVRNTHLLAVAPTKSTASIMGGWSEGINPDPACVFSASTSAGDIDRITPVLLQVMKEKGVFNQETVNSILNNSGSVQHVDWLNEDEKKAFKTAFEIDQHVLVRLAATRQQWIDQGQSLNLFFSASDNPDYISEVHQEAFENENILSLYYIYSTSALKVDRNKICDACQ